MNEYTADQLKIVKSFDRDEATFDLLESKLGNLHYEEARGLIETGYEDVLFGIDESTREIIFDTAAEEAGAFSEDVVEGEEPWLAVFNEYREYINIVKLVRLHTEGRKELNHKFETAKTVGEASNGLSHARHAFRTRPSMSDEEAREIMEACFLNAASILPEAARKAIFQHGSDRYSEDGLGEVFEDFSASLQLAQMILPETSEHDAIADALSARVARELLVARLTSLTTDELQVELRDSDDAETQFWVERELETR